MRNWKILSWLLGSAVLALHAGAALADVAGQAQFVNGEVRLIDAAGGARALRKGDAVNEGDTIDSAKEASAQIRMRDGGFIAVRPDTKLKFDSFKFRGKEDGTENSFFSLFKGGFRAVTGLIGRINKQNYRVTTPVATIGIRGTDHESFYAPVSLPGILAGAYSKVNIGETSLATEAGTISVKPNQMGHAGGLNQPPTLQPLNTNIFTVAPAPAKEVKKEGKEGAGGEQQQSAQGEQKVAADGEAKKTAAAPGESAEVRSTAVVDNTGTAGTVNAGGAAPVAAGPATTTVALPPVVQDTVPLTLVDPASGTILNATAQTQTSSTGQTTPLPTVPTQPVPPTPPILTFAAYTPDHTLIEIATPFMTGGRKNSYMAASGNMTYTGGGLSSFTDNSVGSIGESQAHSVTGGVSPVTGTATSYGTTGIQFGRWTSVTALNNINTQLLGGQNWGAPLTWMYGPQGYLDPGITAPAGQLDGTFSYTLNGSTAPYDKQSGQSGTLTGASISTNFTNNTVSASLALTVGGQAWSASTISPASLSGAQFSASSNPGGVSNNLTISMGAGAPTLCTTCFGNLAGAFTAQNYYGAILSYNLWDIGNAGGNVVGHATLVRSAAVTNGGTAPTGMYFVADYGGSIQTVDTLNNPAGSLLLTPGGVLTAYSSGNPASPAAGYMTTVVAPASSSPPVTSGATGIVFGTWAGGSSTSSWGTGIGPASPHWITGPEAGPLFLPNALIGTKAYAFDGGMVTNISGATGTVLGTTALTVDFTKQVVGINIDLSVPDAMSVTHTWNARTLAGNEAIINGGDGIGGATFHASSYNQATGPGLLTVMVDGSTPGSGNVSGQLTGAGLNGAILSYDLSATLAGPPYSAQANGVAAFVGATSNAATPYRWVMASLTDPTAIIRAPMLGFYANDPTRATFSGSNLTQFDMNAVNNHDKNNASKTLAVGSSAPSNAGNDPVTGISWGRWDGGSVNVTNRAIGGAPAAVPLAGSLHWIAGPTETAAVTLPVSGAFTYTYTGGTFPTDNLNASGSHTATLSANFTAQTVNVGVSASVGGSNMSATASNVPIIQKSAFYADSRAPNAQNLAVTCTGNCGATHEGIIVGGFTGAGATGAMMTYGLEKIGGASPGVISGVAAFQRGAALPP